MAVLGLLANGYYRHQTTSGMETGLAVCLGLAALLTARSGRSRTAGVLLGLALVNKLDAGLLALALGFAWLLVHRELPWRLATSAAFTALPWFGFAWWYYGSPLPNSMLVKTALFGATLDGPELVEQFEKLMDEMCKCPDAECLERNKIAIINLLRHAAEATPTEQQEIQATLERAAECID